MDSPTRWPLASPEWQRPGVRPVSVRRSLVCNWEWVWQGSRQGKVPERGLAPIASLCPLPPLPLTWPLGLAWFRQRRHLVLMCGKAMKRNPWLAQTLNKNYTRIFCSYSDMVRINLEVQNRIILLSFLFLNPSYLMQGYRGKYKTKTHGWSLSNGIETSPGHSSLLVFGGLLTQILHPSCRWTSCEKAPVIEVKQWSVSGFLRHTQTELQRS